MEAVAERVWSSYQSAIYTAVETTNESLIIEAVAGSGKTTCLVECASRLTEYDSAVAVCFNTRIKDELVKRLPAYVGALTLNALGYRAWRAHCGKQMEVDGAKVTKLVRGMSNGSVETRKGIKRLVDLAKMSGVVPTYVQNVTGLRPDTDYTWRGLIAEYGLTFDEMGADEAVEVARRVLAESIRVGAERVDFNDQMYLPVVFGADFPQYDTLFVDECFVGDTPILLDTEGFSLPIQKLFDMNYSGKVVSWDPVHGIVNKWVQVRRTLATKPMVRIEMQRIAYNKKGERLANATAQVLYGKRYLVCTEDHKIWSEGKWIAAKDLIAGQLLMQESVSPRDKKYNNRYKHSESGRVALAKKATIKRFGGTFRGGDIPTKHRGGNGHGPSPCEKILLEKLGAGWESSFVVKTKKGRGSGYPNCYKIDLADPVRRIAIEVDGHSHEYRQEQDAKKDALLSELGWEVIRIKNEDVLSLSHELLQARVFNSPCDAEVISVEPWRNRDQHYVYDLTVEDTHCYFAHGTLVHNCQDVSEIQRVMIERSVSARGRVIAFGDPAQALYHFRGAGQDSLPLLKERFRARSMPLSICYRCSKAVVRAAQAYVPTIEAFEEAPEGKVVTLGKLAWDEATFRPTDVILCRNNAPIVGLAFRLLRAGKPVRVLGRDIGAGLVAMVQRLRASDMDDLREKLAKYIEREVAKLDEDQVGAFFDRIDTLRVFIDHTNTVFDLERKIESLFGDDVVGLTLSTVHKAKGLEWPRVFILNRELIGARAKQDWEKQAERNVAYVAVTRAQQELFYIKTGE